MTIKIDPTDKAAVYGALVAFMTDPVVNIKAGDSGHITQLDFRKVHPDVGVELLRQGGIKPLTDISRDKATEETWAQVADRRLARVKNWYAGDYSVRGGGVADPVAVQMKEEIIAVYIQNGATRKEAQAFVKGTAAQFITSQADKQFGADGNRSTEQDEQHTAWVAARLDHYRTLAEATLRERRKGVDKLDLSKLEI